MSKEERVKEIRKAIKLVGWLVVSDRIKGVEDRAIFNELKDEFQRKRKADEDKILKRHKIKF